MIYIILEAYAWSLADIDIYIYFLVKIKLEAYIAFIVAIAI